MPRALLRSHRASTPCRRPSRRVAADATAAEHKTAELRHTWLVEREALIKRAIGAEDALSVSEGRHDQELRALQQQLEAAHAEQTRLVQQANAEAGHLLQQAEADFTSRAEHASHLLQQAEADYGERVSALERQHAEADAKKAAAEKLAADKKAGIVVPV